MCHEKRRSLWLTWPMSILFFNDTATTEIYTRSLHDALPISYAIAVALSRPASDPVDIHRAGAEALLAANVAEAQRATLLDRKSTRLNSSHANISYAVFCLTKNHRLQVRT